VQDTLVFGMSKAVDIGDATLVGLGAFVGAKVGPGEGTVVAGSVAVVRRKSVSVVTAVADGAPKGSLLPQPATRARHINTRTVRA